MAVVPGYEIVRELGRGGMGVVYEARQVGLNRTVALKMILAGGHASAADLDRFRTEAEAVARLLHPNIVQVYETGTHGGLPYFSLEFCPGGSLDRKLDGTPWEPAPAAALIETLARAIEHAHEHGIVHRDLKPGNILLSADGTPKVTDFGLAKRLDSTAGLTRTGVGFGTPSYMAPEQADSCKTVGPAADTYALGAILYELHTGRPPFRAASYVDTVLQVVSDDPVPPTRLNPKTPRDVETICLKCLAKEPAKRYTSALALAEDLRRFQANEPILARPAGVVEKAVKWAKRRPAVAALSAAFLLALVTGVAGILFELSRAETQEGVANQRAEDLAKQQTRVRQELHHSDLLRADLLAQFGDFAQAEQVLWRAYLTRPDDEDRRAAWRLWNLYRQRPRRSGWWFGGPRRRRQLTITCFSPDGRRAAVVRGSQVSVRDAATGLVHGEFQTPQTDLELATFDRIGRRLGLVSTADGSVSVWDLDPAPVLRATIRPEGEPRPDDMPVAGAGAFSGMTEEQVRRGFQSIAYGLTRLSFLDGNRVVVIGPDVATVWDLNGPTQLARFDLDRITGSKAFLNRTATIAPPPAGDLLPVVRAGEVQFWKVPRAPGDKVERTALEFADTAFRRVPVPDGHTVKAEDYPGLPAAADSRAVSAAAVSPDGRWLVTRQGRGILRAWDVETGAKRGEDPAADKTYLGDMAVTPDGSFVRGTGSGDVRLWRLPRLEPVPPLPQLSPMGLAAAAGFGSDGRQSFLAEGGMVAVYDHDPPAAVTRLDPPAEWKILALNYDVAATGPVVARDATGLAVWGNGPAGRIPRPASIRADADGVFVIDPDGTSGVEVSPGLFLGASFTIYDLARRRAAPPFRLRDADRGTIRMPSMPAFSFDGRRLAVTTEHGLVVVDLSGKKVTARVPNGPAGDWGGRVAFATDGRRLAVHRVRRGLTAAYVDLALVDTVDGRELAAVADQEDAPVGFSPDGSLLATVADRRLVLRDGTTLAPVAELPTDLADTNTSGAFSPDGRMIALGTGSKLRLFDVRRRDELVAIDLAAGPIKKIVFTPDGRKVRFIAETQVGEVDLHAYDPYVEGNLTWNLLRLLPELDRTEADHVLNRLRESHPEAYRAGVAEMESKPPGR
jgi:WD40 repeat protein